MKRYKKYVIVSLLCCVFALIAGCSSSQLVNVWSDAEFQTPSLNKILVMSVSKNPTQRRIWEDAYSVELSKHNVAATASYRLFPDALPDSSQVDQIVKTSGFDGVLVTRRLPPEANPTYVEGYVTQEQSTRYDYRRERFITYYRDIDHAGYVDSQKVDIRVIDVWTTKNDGHMIWSGTSRTPEPNSVQVVRPEIVELVMSQLEQQGIIAAAR